MHPDIVESRDAVEALLGAIRHEEQSLRRLEEEWRGRMRDQASRGALFRNVTSDPFADLDDTLMATGAYWEAYDEGPRIEQLERTIEELRRAIELRRGLVATLAGGILQIARDLITLHTPDQSAARRGRRTIGTQFLKEVIWEGRNQAAHCGESGDYHCHVVKCFTKLASEIDPAFALGPKPDQNHAYRLLRVLGWTDFDRFAEDMDSLLPSAT